jgi:hypothetical protein
MDIAEWLSSLGLGRYAATFAVNEITPETLPYLSDADLKELGLPMGPRKLVLAAIAGLGKAEQTPRRHSTTRAAAERRQLTVMFVDLVGSTALSGQLDPEEMGEVIRRYQNAVAEKVTRLDGHVAKFMGDGVLAYFGWPRAHEDGAERAVPDLPLSRRSPSWQRRRKSRWRHGWASRPVWWWWAIWSARAPRRRKRWSVRHRTLRHGCSHWPRPAV